jgi:uncharacterized protein YneR
MATSSTSSTGRKSNITNAAERLTETNLKANQGVQIYAASGNSNTIYIGTSSGVTADTSDLTDGFPLAAGESILFPVRSPQDIWVIASAAGSDKLWFLVV